MNSNSKASSSLIAQVVADLVTTITATVQHPDTESPQATLSVLVLLINHLITFTDHLFLLIDDGHDGSNDALIDPVSPPPSTPPMPQVAVGLNDPYDLVIYASECFIESPLPPGLEALIRSRPPESVSQNLMAAKSDPRCRRGASKVGRSQT
jgi:hypothetical protein